MSDYSQDVILSAEEARMVASLILAMPEHDYVQIKVTKKNKLKVISYDDEDVLAS